jgi:hypothetical protein
MAGMGHKWCETLVDVSFLIVLAGMIALLVALAYLVKELPKSSDREKITSSNLSAK